MTKVNLTMIMITVVRGVKLEYKFTTEESTGAKSVEVFRVRNVKGDFIVPAEIDGYRVTSIGMRAFSCCTELKSVTIPNGVTRIGRDAFFRCSGLESVTMPNYATSIGEGVFSRCRRLKSVMIPDGVMNIGERAFYRCIGLVSVMLPTGVTSIGNMAFYDCHQLTNISLPDSVTCIGNEAFSRCFALQSITIPAKVNMICGNVFRGCRNLKSISVACANPSYKSDSGMLLTKDGATLLSGVNGYVTIPNGVTRIGKEAFWGCRDLEVVTIPSSVTSIANDAFTLTGCLEVVYVSVGNVDHVKKMLVGSELGSPINKILFLQSRAVDFSVPVRRYYGRVHGIGCLFWCPASILLFLSGVKSGVEAGMDGLFLAIWIACWSLAVAFLSFFVFFPVAFAVGEYINKRLYMWIGWLYVWFDVP